jgi:uncharacterized protein
VLAPDFPPAPGARLIRSDVLRKRLFNVPPETRLPPSAYETAPTECVYRALHDQAIALLAAGYTTIINATFLREDERASIAACSEVNGVPFVGLWLEAPSDVLIARIGARGRDASDADMRVLQQQLKLNTGSIGWHRINAAFSIASYLDALRALTRPL